MARANGQYLYNKPWRNPEPSLAKISDAELSCFIDSFINDMLGNFSTQY